MLQHLCSTCSCTSRNTGLSAQSSVLYAKSLSRKVSPPILCLFQSNALMVVENSDTAVFQPSSRDQFARESVTVCCFRPPTGGKTTSIRSDGFWFQGIPRSYPLIPTLEEITPLSIGPSPSFCLCLLDTDGRPPLTDPSRLLQIPVLGPYNPSFVWSFHRQGGYDTLSFLTN